jgi:hypothetical protein
VIAYPSKRRASSDDNRVALDAWLAADGFVTGNSFELLCGLEDYDSLLGALPSSEQALAQQEFGQDFFIDYLFLSGAA